ncbi:AraC family transcriptional regulator [Polaribacter ponticola]|uniref:Helix-turn-helix transcriptional regulator n=1 Tax=Polaribacter ponticola TaxID=2978475 RepID=A0ABT5SBK5_9FLAO|nr:helix-turn-helix transcriptional regulator [Polaribacter sp. MSW5]MDD7915504.1 helix-turn-helix transcriptional regulator [Polaribacter sp. MSW5]
MPKNSLITHYAKNFQKSNFNILKIEDLFKQPNSEEITSNHKVDFYTLLFISEGDGIHSIDFTDYDYSKGSIMSIRKDQIHKFYINNNTKGYLLCFKEEFLNRYLNEVEVAKSIQMFNELLTSPKTQLRDQDFAGVVNLVAAIENEIFTIKDKYSLQIIRSLIHLLITLIYRIKAEGHSKVQLSNYLKEFIRFQNLLEQEYATTKKVFDYANKLGYSTKKLNTVVNFVANKPAKEFINDTVVIKIKRQLLHSDYSIKEIAFKVGFNDPTNLYKYFKKYTNSTPEAFRKIHKP